MNDLDNINEAVRDAASRVGDPLPRAPKQLRILRKLAALLELTSGYEGVTCWLGKSVVTAKDVEDTLSILEAPRPIIGAGAAENNVKRNENWTLLVQGWPKDNPKEPSAPAYWMKAAVERMLSLVIAELPSGVQRTDPIYMLGGDISALTIGQGVVRPPSEDAASRLAMFYLPVIIELNTDARDPYA